MWASVPCTPISLVATANRSISTGRACSPTTTMSPPRRTACTATPGLAGAPDDSMTRCAPSPPVCSSTALTGSCPAAFTVAVAPSAAAVASRSSDTSTAISGPAPSHAAAATTNAPIPPVPITAQARPGPAPPRRAACSATASGWAMAAAVSSSPSGTARQIAAGDRTSSASPPSRCRPRVW